MERRMRRDDFLKTLAALAAAAALPLSARAAGTNLKMMIPANPGGGWDSTGRALGKALQESGEASAVTFENKGGAAGAIGMAQLFNASKGDGNAMMVMGAVMLGGIITGKPPVSVTQVTPLARLTSEYNVLRAAVEFAIQDDGRRGGAAEEGPGQREVGRRFARLHRAHRGGHDCARSRRGRGQDQLRAVPGGGEATAAILGGNVTGGRQRLQRIPAVHRGRQDEAPSASRPTRASRALPCPR